MISEDQDLDRIEAEQLAQRQKTEKAFEACRLLCAYWDADNSTDDDLDKAVAAARQALGLSQRSSNYRSS